MAITNIAPDTCYEWPFYVDFKMSVQAGAGSISSIKLYGTGEFRPTRVLVGTATNEPYVVRWSSRGSSEHWTFQAEATDDQGGVGFSELLPVYVTQDPGPPFIRIVQPDGSMAVAPSTPIDIKLSLWCMEGNLKPVQVYVDGNLFGEWLDDPLQITHPGLPEGPHVLRTVYHGYNLYSQLTNEVRFLVGTFQLSSPTIRPDGRAQFKLVSSIPNASGVIQMSSDLVSWVPVATNSSASTGFVFTESTTATNLPVRFYRALLLP